MSKTLPPELRDLIDAIAKDFASKVTDAMTKAYGAGNASALSKIIAAATADAMPIYDQRVKDSQVVAKPDRRPLSGRSRRYPYGSVKKAMTEALNEFPDGLSRQDIISAAETMAKLVIDDETARNTLKVMARKREAYVDGGIWRLGQRPDTQSGASSNARDLWEPV